jgi:DNA-binding winged helix-turn-helix (wHTH) protein/TolB-like protein
VDQSVDRCTGAFRIGEHRIVPLANDIDGTHVDAKAMDVLVCLAEAAPEVVTNAALFERVWPKVVVGDNVLHQAIAQLRRALGDDARAPHCIENIPRRGYRLVQPVDRMETPAPKNAAERVRSRRRTTAIVAAIALCAVAAGLAAYWLTRGPPAPAYDTRSLAILPLAIIGAEPALEPLAEGLLDDVLVELSGFREPSIASRSAVRAYRNGGHDLPTVGDALRVGYVLEGSIRQVLADVRVTVRLIRTEDGFHVWSQDFEREESELSDDTRPLARTIAHVARVRTLTDDTERSWLRDPGPNDPEAVEYFLRGRREARNMSEGRGGDWDLILSLYERAIEIDPTLRSAHLLIANDQTNIVGWRVPVDEARERAYAALARAFELEPRGSWALDHWIYGKVLLILDLDYDAANREFDAALALDPEISSLYMFQRAAHASAGRIEAAGEAFARERATQKFFEAEPVELLMNQIMVISNHFVNREWAETRAACEAALDLTEVPLLDAKILRIHAWAAAELGEADTAAALAERAWALTGSIEPHAYIGTFTKLGQRERAQRLANVWDPDAAASKTPARWGRPDPWDTLENYTALADVDNLVKFLQRAVLKRNSFAVSYIRSAKIWDPMRSDPRFQSLIGFLAAEEARSRAAGREVRRNYGLD